MMLHAITLSRTPSRFLGHMLQSLRPLLIATLHAVVYQPRPHTCAHATRLLRLLELLLPPTGCPTRLHIVRLRTPLPHSESMLPTFRLNSIP